MYEDDFWEDASDSPIEEELLRDYENLKEGHATRFLEEEEFDFLIDYFFQNDNETEAITASEIALQYFPFSTLVLLKRAEILFHTDRFGQATQALDNAENLSGITFETVLLRIDILLAEERFKETIDFLKQMLPNFSGKEKIELLLELSDVYDEDNDFEEVFKVLKYILKLAPGNEEALHKIGFWADFCGFQEESIKIHQALIDHDPYNALAWFNLGNAWQGLKKYEEAIDAYEYCIAIDEKYEPAFRNLAEAYIKKGWFEKAIESLQMHLKFGKPEDVIYEALGHCFEKQKDFQNARQYYQEALRLNPADDIIFFRIGETYSKERDWEKAAQCYTSALSINKQNPNYLRALGNSLIELEAFGDAVLCLVTAIELRPMVKSNWVSLLQGLYKAECFEEILKNAQSARDLLGNKSEWFYFLALANFSLGKTKEALNQLEEGLVLSSRNVKIILQLNPELLQRTAVATLISKYRHSK